MSSLGWIRVIRIGFRPARRQSGRIGTRPGPVRVPMKPGRLPRDRAVAPADVPCRNPCGRGLPAATAAQARRLTGKAAWPHCSQAQYVPGRCCHLRVRGSSRSVCANHVPHVTDQLSGHHGTLAVAENEPFMLYAVQPLLPASHGRSTLVGITSDHCNSFAGHTCTHDLGAKGYPGRIGVTGYR